MTLDPLDPVALDGSPAQAFASHRARAVGIARHFAIAHPLAAIKEGDQANEDNTTTLLAHFHAAENDPTFATPGAPPSASAAPAALRRLNMGNGLVGSAGLATRRDYDMALKGLVVLAHRYPQLLDAGINGQSGVDFILRKLVPASLSGGHPPEIESVELSFLKIDAPETENHLLMIESSRYLFNQLRFDRSGDPRCDNRANGLTAWLLDFMRTIARHDFLEFNSSPYARMSIHSLLNLCEFARGEEIRTAAWILLDQAMMKCALSSNRGRRVAPFRRQQHRIAHQANQRDDLYSGAGDQMTGFLLAYTGLTGADENRTPVRFPASQSFNALLAGTADYRPPPAVYALAMDRGNPPSLHRFFHGRRPRLPSSPDDADPGVEIHHHSPSFLMSAGGCFLNSGYGHDEITIGDIVAWEQTSRAQATTLIPTRADVLFHDLPRFEPHPDPWVDPLANDPERPACIRATAVNIGVERGLMAGANLRPAEKKTVLEHSLSEAPALALHNGAMLVAWRGGGGVINVARAQSTTLLGVDGVEGVERRVALGETTDATPAIASNDGRLFLAWRSSGDGRLNLAASDDDGRSLVGKTTLDVSSVSAPAIASHDGQVFLAWTGVGDGKINVARVVAPDVGSGFKLGRTLTLDGASDPAPALASHDGRLFLAWKGPRDGNLNLTFSEDDGATFRGKTPLGVAASHAPALASHSGRLFIAWKSLGDNNLNVARVTLGVDGLEARNTLDETSDHPPSLASFNGLLFLGWRGEDEGRLNLRVSRDGSFIAPGPWFFSDLTPMGFYLAAYRAPVSKPCDLDPPPENLGFVLAVEKSDMDARGVDFNRFRELTLARNAHLPATLAHGGLYEFHGPDGRNFLIWFQLTGQKYQARVVDLANQALDLDALPLVSGEYMNAPGGHDGLIEIRHPDAMRAPLVLDFRVAERPSRIDNKASHPQPWIDRALALFDLAPRLDRLGRPNDMRAALADAARLHAELLRLNPAANGPPLAPGVLKGLAALNIDIRAPEGETLKRLADPSSSPHPAIAQALLLLGRKLKAPASLEAIISNYEKTASSPRVVADARPDALKAAMLTAWNARYGTRLADFERILAVE